MTAPDPRTANAPVMSPEDRSARLAVTVFPILVLAAAAFGYFASPTAKQVGPHVNTLLMIIMFGMGLTLTVPDFKLVLTRPWPILIGVLAQYAIMPLIGFGVAAALGLPPDLAAGVILVGCAPGGTASNVVAYLAKADTALSVTMTSISTLLAPLMTPMLTLWLAGQYMPVDGLAMAKSIMQIVLIPVIGGLVIRMLLPRLVNPLLPAMPWVSVVAISGVVLAVVGGSAERVAAAGAIVFLAVVLHNGLGYLLGYLAGRITRQPIRSARTIAIEVGMQNSGLAAGLAAQYFNPAAALPGAVFSIWHNLSGAFLAMYFRRRSDVTREAADS
ncbi:MAG: bile acid:sodium symporter family protein [Dermatophilus congolensis]|nr:bile acid:sodium symporter family protein [Dermatophilus congolensis]